MDPTAPRTVPDDAFNDVLRSWYSFLCFSFGRRCWSDSIPQPAWYLRQMIYAHAIFDAILIDQNRDIRIGAHAEGALCLWQELNGDIFRSGWILRTRAALDACQ